MPMSRFAVFEKYIIDILSRYNTLASNETELTYDDGSESMNYTNLINKTSSLKIIPKKSGFSTERNENLPFNLFDQKQNLREGLLHQLERKDFSY